MPTCDNPGNLLYRLLDRFEARRRPVLAERAAWTLDLAEAPIPPWC
ncbi:hypothetical protein [Rubellimicrobium rubrum]|nr:hypothetical protein [Rubellimicrobium rubrum]